VANSKRFIRKTPTPIRGFRQKKIDVARDQLAGKEINVGRGYRDHRDSPARFKRFKIVVTRDQTKRHVEEGLGG